MNTPKKINLKKLNPPWLLTAGIFLVAGAGIAMGADYPTTVLSLNPSYYYRLDETKPVPAADSGMVTNSGSLGAIGNGPFSGIYGPSGYVRGVEGALAGSTDTAAAFGGGGVNIPFAAALHPNAPFTVECWAKPTAVEGSQFPVSPFAGIEATVGRQGWVIYQTGLAWQFRLGDNTGYVAQPVSMDGTAAVDQWSHVVGVFDGTTAYLYVDGELADQVDTERPFMPNPTQTLDIGTASAFGRTFGGSVDEAAIYTNALSAAEIKAHFDNGRNAARTTPYDQLILAQKPVAYYRMNEPAWTPPATTDLPVAVNTGTLGTAANGVYNVGVQSGLPGVPRTGFGANNYAASFNGRVGNIAIPPQSLMVTELTITCWVKRDGQQLGSSALVFTRDMTNGGTATGLGYIDNNNLRIHWNDGEYDWDSALIVPDNTWTFTALVVTPEQTVIYMNDQAATNEATHTEHDMSVAPLLIGQDPCCGVRIVKGLIDEVAVFDKALTPEQIQQLYAAAGTALPSNQQPAELGQTVNGYQDDFTGSTRDPNWVAVGPGGDHYLQQDGVLKVFVSSGDPNHLLYMAPGASNLANEVLARLRVVNFSSGDAARGGIAVNVSTNVTGHLNDWIGVNLNIRNNSEGTPASTVHFKMLDDLRAWGPQTTFGWTNNVWYWMRLKMDPKADGTNTAFAKVWVADNVTPEPADWQIAWKDADMPSPKHGGFAGITGCSSDGVGQLEVDYILIKSAGLPSTKVDFATTTPGPTPPLFTGIAKNATATTVAINWFGGGKLQTSSAVTGPWQDLTNSLPPLTVPLTGASAAGPVNFYRLTK